MSGKTIRAFVALTPDRSEFSHLDALSRDLKKEEWAGFVRWIRPENMHMTLRFIGDVPEGQVPDILAALSDAVEEIGSFAFNLSGISFLPSASRPRVLVLETEKNQNLMDLAESLESAVVSLGFEPEKRKFRGHFTLARCRRDFPRKVALKPETEKISITAREVVLYQSILGPSGSTYIALGRVALGSINHSNMDHT